MSLVIPASTTSSPNPQNENVRRLAKEVLRFFQLSDGDPELVNAAITGINNGIRELNKHRWRWSEKYTDINLVVDQLDYTLPDDFDAPRLGQLLDTSDLQDSVLKYFPESEFRQAFRDADANHIAAFTITNDIGLTVNAKPSTAFIEKYPKLRLRYYARTPFVGTNTDVVDVPPEVELFLIWYARWELGLIRNRPGTELAERHWRNSLVELRAKDNDDLTDSPEVGYFIG